MDKQKDKDYSKDLKLVENIPNRYFLFGLGLLSTALGIIGIVLPVMPTTVFILLAAYFFARSSPKFYNWIMNHKVFGGMVRDWQAGLGMSLRTKFLAVGMMGITIGFSLLAAPFLWSKILLFLLGISLSVYILTRPTKP